jgi:hypothetical protein
MSDQSTPYLTALLGLRRSLKQIAARPDTPETIRADLTVLQFHIKSVVNTQYPLASSNCFVLTEQETLLRQHEAITKTARETLHKILQQLDSMDFRPLASAADYAMKTIMANVDNAMKTIMANVDNDKLSDADFRDFIRDFIRTFSAGKPHETRLADECVTETDPNQNRF